MRRYLIIATALSTALAACGGPAPGARDAHRELARGNFDIAAQKAERTLETHPDDPTAWRVRIRATMGQGDFAKASALYAQWYERRGSHDAKAYKLMSKTVLWQGIRVPAQDIVTETIRIIASHELEAFADDVRDKLGHDSDLIAAAASVALLRSHPAAPQIATELLESEDERARQLVVKGIARKIGKRAAKRYDAGNPALASGDTTYLCTADRAGNMVSLIQSNYRGMGSGMVPDGLGFGLQDRGQLFSLQPGHANVYAPGKRPFHTIIPAFVSRGGKPWLAYGVMGGAAQPQMHAQVLMNLVDFNMTLQEAGDAPRMLHLGSSQPTGEVMSDGGTVYLERGIDDAIVRKLQRRGHRVERRTGAYGGYQAIAREGEFWHGASESRKDGQALGY